MIKLKRILRFLIYTIKENRVKMFMILCTIALLYPIFNCDYDLKEQAKVITTFKYGVNTYYVIENDNTVNGCQILKFSKEQPISQDHFITKHVDNVLLILSWVAFVILCIILLIATFFDDDTNWGFDNVWAKVLHRDIVCEFEAGYYYYILDNN